MRSSGAALPPPRPRIGELDTQIPRLAQFDREIGVFCVGFSESALRGGANGII
jgi:hypothetical protein